MSRKGFTLIELLVVISIISLLASVVLASLNSARDKGRMAAGKYFATQVNHVAGDQAFGIWDFDEGAGSVAADRSGFRNDAALANGPAWSTDTPSGKGTALLFNGSTQYGVVTHTADFDAPYITVAAWVKTPSTGWRKLMGQGPDATEVFGLYVNPNGYFNVEREINGAQVGGVGGSNGPKISDNLWHYVAYSYDGSVESLYVDGALTYKNSISGTMTSSSENISIGAEKSSISQVMYWNGLIDEARFYAKALTAGEIGRLYAEGANKHSLATAH